MPSRFELKTFYKILTFKKNYGGQLQLELD